MWSQIRTAISPLNELMIQINPTSPVEFYSILKVESNQKLRKQLANKL